MPKILVIDDKKDNLIVMSALLTRMVDNCQVITADSGKEGLEKAETQTPDTILLDIKMPGMDGYEVCRRLKTNTATQNIPVIMISALKTESADLARGLECGADAYLAKPVDGYVLTAQVNTALRIKRSEDLLRSQKQLLEDMVTERTEKLYQSQKKLDIKNKIAESFLFENDEESYLRVIKVAMEALESNHGTIAYIDKNNSLVWTAMPGRSFEHCRTEDKTLVFPKEKWTGLWGKALTGNMTLSSNGPFYLPRGHLNITRAIVTPLSYKKELVGCIMLANKDSDYTNEDKLLLEEIAQYVAPVVQARLQSYRQSQKKKELEAQLL
ncbi:MAG: response regulator, partial [Desulfobacteraceae bacterium]